jgi:hypothetical protein
MIAEGGLRNFELLEKNAGAFRPSPQQVDDFEPSRIAEGFADLG